jgi:hypothetical protein
MVIVFFASQSAALTNSAALATYCSASGATVAGGGALPVAGGATGGAVGGASVTADPADEQAARMRRRLPRIDGTDAVCLMTDLSIQLLVGQT